MNESNKWQSELKNIIAITLTNQFQFLDKFVQTDDWAVLEDIYFTHEYARFIYLNEKCKYITDTIAINEFLEWLNNLPT